MDFFTTERIGESQSKTPEGFLLCAGTPIARIGVQDYGPYEIPVPIGNDGKIHVMREESEVFRKETIDSFAGKSVVVGHPEDDVVPSNWRELTKGFVLNPRRGTGDQTNLLVADLLVTDAETIGMIERRALREVSCGYDAKYEIIEPGYARQHTIVGNHVALVEKARCGEECSIQDHATRDCCDEEEGKMTVKERISKLFEKGDKAGLAAVLDELPEEKPQTETHVHVHVRDAEESEEEKKKREEEKEKDAKTTDAIKGAVADAMKPMKDSINAIDARLKKVEDAKEVAGDDPDDDDDKKYEDSVEDELPVGVLASKVKDSKQMEDSFQETVALAEIISPGIKLPTFDAKLAPKETAKALCNFRRRTLDAAAAARPEVKEFMDQLIGGRDFKTYDCGGVRTVFLAVGAFSKKLNTTFAASTRDLNGTAAMGKVKSLTDINKQNREYYKD